MTKQVRVRFAPSPTGHLHIGGLRTALFNYLYARHLGGSFLLRIEDTDPERSLEKYTQEIVSSLQWADITADEPIIIQSHRIVEHNKLIEQLLATNNAYRCYCVANASASKDAYFKYDGTCSNFKERVPGKPYVIRLKLPLEKKTVAFNDLIRGLIEFELDQFDDFIIVRSDGTPMYNFVVVADDAAMGITQVIRGEEHIPNTPKQILLYEALGFSIPEFAHLPLILSPTGQKLSKRDAAVAVIDYQKKGYLADALCNYLTRLGWACGDKEIFSRHELINLFTLDGIGKKGAIFDQEKLDWVNGLYIREKSSEYLLECINNDVDPGWRVQYSSIPNQVLYQAIQLYKERVSTLRQLVDELTLLFAGPQSYNQEDLSKHIGAQTEEYLQHLVGLFENMPEFSEGTLEGGIKKFAKERGIPLAQLAQPMRIALVGKTSSPGIFALLSLIGRENTLQRFEALKKEILSKQS